MYVITTPDGTVLDVANTEAYGFYLAHYYIIRHTLPYKKVLVHELACECRLSVLDRVDVKGNHPITVVK